MVDCATIKARASHPSRVRELKLSGQLLNALLKVSHPSRVRELKPQTKQELLHEMCRTPPGCVN